MYLSKCRLLPTADDYDSIWLSFNSPQTDEQILLWTESIYVIYAFLSYVF